MTYDKCARTYVRGPGFKSVFGKLDAGRYLAQPRSLEVHEVIANNRYLRKAVAQEPSPALLRGLIFTETGVAMTPHHTQKGTRRYRYHVSMDMIKKRPKAELRGPQRLPGGMVEDAVVGEIRRLLRTPEVAARVSWTLRKDLPDLGEADISASLTYLEEIADETDEPLLILPT